MKEFLFPALLLLLCSCAQSQLLTVNPLFPAENAAVTIVADCSKGNQGLYNYSSTTDVYVHVGVITNLSTSNSDWKYVPFTWGTTNIAAQAVSLGANKYQYTINNIRNFFAVPVGEKILKIAILFRNGAGTQKQTNSDGTDMFVQVYGTTLAAAFVLPPYQPTFTPVPEPIQKNIGDNININFQSSQPAALSIYLNGSLINSGNAITYA